MEAAIRLSSWSTFVLYGVIYLLFLNGVFPNNTALFPKDFASQPCDLSSGKEGVCVYGYACRNNTVNIDGAGIIDLRFSDVCEDYFLKCCSKETPCLENSGTCVPATNCGANRNDIKYKKFTQTDECEWSGYICCPNDEMGKEATEYDTDTNTEPSELQNSIEQYETCDNDSVCVYDNQCLVEQDGESIIQERVLNCSGKNQTCCPRDKVRGDDPCGEVGGTCIRENLCPASSSLKMDLRISQCEEFGFVCCMQEADDGRTQFIDKICSGGKGKCTPKKQCRGTTYRDRKNECGGLACCATFSTSTTPHPSVSKSTTHQPGDLGYEGKKCSSNRGICMTGSCLGDVYNDINNDCGGLTCCAESLKKPDESIKECGYRNENGVMFDTIGRENGESQFGEFPWMVAVMVYDNEKLTIICGGSLIDPEVVLTSAECAKTYKRTPNKLIVRAGEWDMGTEREPINYEERRVTDIKSHPNFKATSLVNNIALLFLEDKFDLSSTINIVCLPDQNFTINNGEVIATGWGSTPQNRTKYQQILKKIDLPFVERSGCERTLRRATINSKYQLHRSFICAGGVAGIDTCTGDGGSPIVYPVPNDFESRYYAVGMVSWGVGCGKSGIPAAYTDIGFFREWVDNEMEKHDLNSHYYTYVERENDN